MLEWLRKKPKPKKAYIPVSVAAVKRKESKLDELLNREIKQELQYYDVTKKDTLDPKIVQSARKEDTLQPIFWNPNSEYDYSILAAVCQSTIVGALVENISQFVCGKDIMPKLELVNPSGDTEKDQKELDKYKNVLEDLHSIQDHIDRSNDISFYDFVCMLVTSTIMYNRAALVFSDSTEYKGIPTSIRFADARDLSITTFTRDNRIESVLWQHQNLTPVYAHEMCYLWNPIPSVKSKMSYGYGNSLVTPLLDAAKSLRKVIIDFQAMSELAWASSFILTMSAQGASEAERDAESENTANKIAKGGISALVHDEAQEIGFHNVDFKARVLEFKELGQWLVDYCAACLGLPAFSLTGDANRATARSRIQMTVRAIVEPLRDRLARQICSQTYQRWADQLHENAIGKVRVVIGFKEIEIAEALDRLETTLRAESRKQFTDKAFGEQAGIEDYEKKVDPDAPTHAGGQGEAPHSLEAKDHDGKHLDDGNISRNKEGLE